MVASLSHLSLILDVNDTCWNSYFTSAEITEIKQHNEIHLPIMPYNAKTYLDQLEAISNEDLYDMVNSAKFESDTDCKWIQDSFNSCF